MLLIAAAVGVLAVAVGAALVLNRPSGVPDRPQSNAAGKKAATATAPDPEKRSRSFASSGRPLIVDVDHDGLDDVLLSESRETITAFSGKDGSTVWVADVGPAASGRPISYVVADALVSFAGVDLRVVDLTTGKPRRKVVLDDNAVMACRGEAGRLRLLLASNEVADVDAATGEARLEKKGAPCDEVASDVVSRNGGNLRRAHPVAFLPPELGAVGCGSIRVVGSENYFVSDPCARLLGPLDADTLDPRVAIPIGGGQVFLAQKVRGRRTAMVGRVEGGKVAWSTSVSSAPEAEQLEESPTRAAVSGEQVAVLAETKERDGLAVLDGVSGARVLDVALPAKGIFVAAAKNRWVVVCADRVLSIDASKGDVVTLVE